MNIYIKLCSSCKIPKSSSEFYKSKGQKDGFQNQCKTCLKKYQKSYYHHNKDAILENRKDFYKENKSKLNEHSCEYQKDRYANNFLCALRKRVRSLIRHSLTNNGYTKASKTHEILGCSYEEFHAHIENQFMEGMSWDNRSDWHLDHITPISWGTTEEEIIALNHYTNFQPLWALENRKKSNKFTG